MRCEICGRINHDYRCPYHTPLKSRHYCSICGENISIGENYIENEIGEYAHYDCITGVQDLLEFFGCKIQNMEEEI